MMKNALLTMAVAAACFSYGAQADEKTGGDIVVTYQNDVATLDPAIGYDWQNWSMIKSLFDGLMDYRPGTTELVNDLAGPAFGIGILAAGVILAIMIIPYIAAVMRDVFEQTPVMMKESAYGIGCTTWEVIWRIVLPFTKNGVIGGVMLGLGRALGETMAVTFIIGNTYQLDSISLYMPGNSITSALANEFAEAETGLHVAALMELGLILFVITFIVLAASKFMIMRLAKNEGAR